jgi:sugar transferase (PEP-CTERM/EpsH1 system associated)
MKLVILASRFPWPLDKGDKLRMFYQIKHLSELNEIYLLAISDRDVSVSDKKELLKYCKEVHVFYLSKPTIAVGLIRAFFNSKPLQIGYFYSQKISNEINTIIEEIKPDYIYGQLVRVSEYIKNSNYPKCLDYQDALSAGLKRRFERANLFVKWIFKLEYNRMFNYEESIHSSFNVLTIITETDRQLLPESIRSNVEIITNGVDIEFFSEKKNLSKDYEIVFTGNMNYPPNVSAAQFLVNDIMPLVWKSMPTIKVLIAGSSPSSAVKSLSSNLVEVSGWIDDIRTAYQSAKVFVAPMQIGTGLQNKLLEAMASGIPCVTSDLANNALGALDGKQILVAPKKSASVFADKIISLLSDETFAQQIAYNGNLFVQQTYDWSSTVKKLNTLF